MSASFIVQCGPNEHKITNGRVLCRDQHYVGRKKKLPPNFQGVLHYESCPYACYEDMGGGGSGGTRPVIANLDRSKSSASLYFRLKRQNITFRATKDVWPGYFYSSRR